MLFRGLRPLLLLACLLLSLPLAADEATPEAEANNTATDPTKEFYGQLDDISTGIASTQQELMAARAALKRAKDEQEKAQATAEIERLTRRLNDQRMSFEKLATGGLDTRLFYEQAESKIDLKQDFDEVVRPLLYELKKMTEHPRMLERLRGERRFLQTRLEVAEAALDKVEQLKKGATLPGVKKDLIAMEAQWQQRRDDTASQLQLAQLQMDELTNPKNQGNGRLGAAFSDFFSGRGLNLLLGAGTFLASYFGLFAATRAMQRRLLDDPRRRNRFWPRLLILTTQMLSLAVSLLLTMMVLYMRGDWLMLALVIIFMLGAMWALRMSLPRYLMESRILLNIGPVRDGERVIFRGIPWQITSLNVFSTLHNPCLRGATIRLGLGEMARLHSRPFGPEEPWFPSREGDYVMLDGDLFGRVLMQTPEIVQMTSMGAVKTYGIESYISAHPRNLSQNGFAVTITFGLDYAHQREITGEVCEVLTERLRERLAGHEQLGQFLVDAVVEFDHAAASSLELLMVGVFTAPGAEHFFPIKRLMSRVAVETCNEQGWVMPFNQLTLHVAEGGTAAARQRGAA